MTNDVVAELDCWLGQWDSGYFAGAPSLETIPLVERARDEIVALRKTVERQRLVLSKGHAETRDAALEDAAEICDLSAEIMQPDADDGRLSDAIAAVKSCAAAIRKLNRTT